MRSSGNQRFQVWEVSTRLLSVSSTLQEVGILPQEERGFRLGESVHLGEGIFAYASPMMGLVEFLVHLGEAFARLGELLHLREGRLRLGKPVIVLRPVFMACLGSVLWPSL